MVKLNYRVDHVIKNQYSRSGDPLLRLQAIVVHYTANPHANAADHQRFFDGADGGNYRYAGAHIFVDKDEAIEVIPLNEVGYHANERKAGPLLATLKATAPYYRSGNANLLTIGIEMCIEKDGSFHPDTIERTRLVIKDLQRKFPQLADTKNRVVRHYDVTGKNCPKPFVEKPAEWVKFLKSIDEPAAKAEAQPKRLGKSAKIQTGGLKPEFVKEVAEHFIAKKWYAEIKFDGKGNPYALTGGLNDDARIEFEGWLKERGWWYKVI